MGVSKIIEDTVAEFDNSVYMRATDYEANIEAEDIALEGLTLFVYNNLPVIGYGVEIGITKQWPVSIKILQKAGTDDNTADEDEIREALVPVAQELWSKLTNNPAVSKAWTSRSFTIEFLKIHYDAVLVGVELAFDLELTTNIC